jgi:hypothetical protein
MGQIERHGLQLSYNFLILKILEGKMATNRKEKSGTQQQSTKKGQAGNSKNIRSAAPVRPAGRGSGTQSAGGPNHRGADEHEDKNP